MILRLDTPPLPRAIPSLRIVRWHCAEGDHVPFGTLLVELRAEATLRRLRPSTGSKRGRKARALDEQTGDTVAEDAPRFRVEILASEPAYLRRVAVPEGGAVAVGDPLALLSTDPDDAVDGAGDGAPAYRAVAEVIRIDADLLAEEL